MIIASNYPPFDTCIFASCVRYVLKGPQEFPAGEFSIVQLDMGILLQKIYHSARCVAYKEL